ncbi:MAG: hypothetical protein CME64_15840 [Halobacteriovoraceae bacterium]|nr:hypothetical protein [Halobacteriovoraceae bacterium]|tara:strand:+ start:19071 stop:20225 length:1155 start_codon:yes stop_codon:yes gene_type:complete
MSLPYKAETFIEEILNLLKPADVFKNIFKFYHNQIFIEGSVIDVPRQVHLFGLGKAASFEVEAMKNLINGSKLKNKLGMCVSYTKREHIVEDEEIAQLEGDHPVITEDNIGQTKKFISMLQKANKDDVLIFLLSGGGSALLEMPVDGMSFKQLQAKHQELLNSGLNINQMNAARKAISKVKNGGLLNFIPCDNIVQLVTCDIPNEEIADVSSGPLINKERADKRVQSVLTQSAGTLLKRLTSGHKNARIDAIYDCTLEEMCQSMLGSLPTKEEVVLSGGEGTLKVLSDAGLGGRSTHFVLHFAHMLYNDPDNRDIKILSLGTDGTDGPTDAAGAYIDYELYDREEALEHLQKQDSYNYFKKKGSLIKTGPTMNNLMDVRILWRE